MSRYYRVKTLMLKGEKGDTGYSISNIQMNDDYTLTITIESGMQFNTPPIRGEKGEQGTGIRSVELRDDYSLLITLENGKTLETTAILGKEFENIRTLEASATSASKIATSASTSASASAQSASEASISASESASNASTSASASAHSATNASQSATNAQESASSASTSADTATSKATEASASATKAKESETNAKSSETNASNSAEEAKASAVNAKASETKAEEYANNLQNSTETISKLNDALVNQKEAISELSDKKITKFYAGNLGETHITDSDNGKIMDMLIYGKSWQLKTTGRNILKPNLKYNDEFSVDFKKGTVLTMISKNSAENTTGGNVTIGGQQYIADYIDVERGKIVRRCEKATLNTNEGYADETYRLMFNLPSNGGDGESKCLYSAFNWESWTTEQVQALKALKTYYPTTNIKNTSEQLDGYTVFNYPISMANGWNNVKKQLNDNRDYIYDMDLQSAEAYVNSEYAVTLTELEV